MQRTHKPFTDTWLDLGFSGSRNEPSAAQRKWLLEFMLHEIRAGRVKRAHHGCCIGSDAYFHRVCKSLLDVGLEEIVLHPPTDRSREMALTEWEMTNCLWYPRKPYLQRNRDIALTSSRLAILPDRPEQLRGSGTWNTAKQAKEFRHTVLSCTTNGQVSQWIPGLGKWMDV